MRKQDMERIVQGYYDALEEGRILGRKCKRCDHIEFPPYLACNECGCLDTEWVELNGMRGRVTQALPTVGAFGDPEFRKLNGDYLAIGIQIPHIDDFCSSLLHVDTERYDEFCKKVDETEVYVKPLIIQDEDTKVVVWELEDEEFKKMPDMAALAAAREAKAAEAAAEEAGQVFGQAGENGQTAVSNGSGGADIDVATDPIAQTVLSCAADAYGVEESVLTMATDIREDLSNESMKMIVMISEIEEELDVTIEIQEASLLNTLADFVNKIKEKIN